MRITITCLHWHWNTTLNGVVYSNKILIKWFAWHLLDLSKHEWIWICMRKRENEMGETLTWIHKYELQCTTFRPANIHSVDNLYPYTHKHNGNNNNENKSQSEINWTNSFGVELLVCGAAGFFLISSFRLSTSFGMHA